MPTDSRTQRRQSQRSGGPPPKQKADPMRYVYIGVAAVFVLFIAGLGLMRWQQNNAIAAAYATPTPVPSSSSKGPTPIAIVDGTAIGKPLIKTGKVLTDTPKGGQGQPVDGIPCATQEYVTLHVHPHLSIFYNGQQAQVPRYIGGAPAPGGGCLYWIHTHDATGLIHVEAPQLQPPGGSAYTLGILFDIWGQPLTRNDVAGLKGPVTAFVDGQKYDGELTTIPLKAHSQITLEVGSPIVTPPVYTFPVNE